MSCSRTDITRIGGNAGRVARESNESNALEPTSLLLEREERSLLIQLGFMQMIGRWSRKGEKSIAAEKGEKIIVVTERG